MADKYNNVGAKKEERDELEEAVESILDREGKSIGVIDIKVLAGNIEGISKEARSELEPTLGDMLEYIEAQNKALDEEGKEPPTDSTTSDMFMSGIKFNGVSILPPVLTVKRREEMHLYKSDALRLESKKRARRRDELHARVQHIVAGVEERRAAKAAAKLASSPQQSPSSGKPARQPVEETVTKLVTPVKESSSRLVTGSSTVNPVEGGRVPVSITISVPDNAVSDDSVSEKHKETSKASPSGTKVKTGAFKDSCTTIASKRSNLSYVKNMGQLSKKKSFSSQCLDRTPSDASKVDSESSYSPGKRDVSPKSRVLLPHPPSGRPGCMSPMRQSASTPDLRTIDFTVETDELRKPIRSHPVKGGSPQSGDTKENVPDGRNKVREKKTSEKDRKISEKENASSDKSEQFKSKKLSSKDALKKESEKSKDIRKPSRTENDRNIKSRTSKNDQSEAIVQNPLEKLEQELSMEDERAQTSLAKHKQINSALNKEEEIFKEEKRQRAFLAKQRQDELALDKVRTEIDPIEMAAAELQALNITEEQALATLDSLQSDFASLEQIDNLPEDYNGIPLQNKKQQQIIHMLTKLSKALNIEDTLTSTTSSNASGEPNKDNNDNVRGERPGIGDKECVQNGAYSKNLSQVVVGELDNGADDSSISNTSGSNMTGPSQHGSILSSASSNHSRARMSPNGSSSILSSASSISGSRLRMSPKSLKNTVHFSSFVTEISTSASQSMEDKISVRKMDITPVNSANFETADGATSQLENVPKNLSGSIPGHPQQPDSLLSKVALSPSVDLSGSSPGEEFEQNQESDLNTSDKENEFVPQTESSDENYENRPSGRHSHVLNVYTANIPEGPIGSQHPALIKSSVKSDGSDITLKGSQDKLSSQENLPKYMMTMEQQYGYGPESTDFSKPSGVRGTDSSISSLQEEITRSYILSQHKQFGNKTAPLEQRNKKEELKRASMKGSINQWECSPIILKPVNYNCPPKQDIENGAIQQNLRTGTKHLDKVDLDVSEIDSDTDDEEENIENTEPKQLMDIDHYEDSELADKSEQCNEIKENINIKETDNTGEPLRVENTVHNSPIAPQQENELEEGVTATGDEEEEGKAEHIQRYLTHIHEQSLQNEEEFKSIEDNEIAVQGDANVLDNISNSITSFMSSIQSMNHLSHEELFQLQAKQFEILQQQLIDQQQAQLEELFVQQRREQLNLQHEIEDYQHKLQVPDDIETINLGGSFKPKITVSQPQVGAVTAWPFQPPVQSSTEPVHSQMNFDPNISQISHNTSLSTIPFVPPVGQCDYYGNQAPTGYQLPVGQFPNNQPVGGHPQSNQMPACRPLDNQPTLPVKKPLNNKNQYAYIPSPSISRNPKDFDNTSDVSSILLKGSPKQLVFSNHSTPVKKEPKVYKPVQRSPMKPGPVQRQMVKVTIPQEIFEPVMQQKFARVSAAVKGYLTRRLLKTQKVQEILKTIKDTRNFAFSFQAETPIKKGTLSREDRTLLERIIAQLQAALLDIHEIFFIISIAERMAIISHSRQLEQDKILRESQRGSVDSVSRSQHRLSTATLKAMERKKKAQLAEEAVFGSCEFRPKSAPPATSSPAIDVRALKPLQGHISPIRPDSEVSVREIKERPKSAPNKHKKDTTGSKNRKTSSAQTSNKTSKAAGQTMTKTKPAPTRSKKLEKAWR